MYCCFSKRLGDGVARSFTPLHWGSLSLGIADGLSHATFYSFFSFFLVLGIFPRCRINPVCCLILPRPGPSISFTLERLCSCFLEYLGVGCLSSCLHSFGSDFSLDPDRLETCLHSFLWTVVCTVLFILSLYGWFADWMPRVFSYHFKKSVWQYIFLCKGSASDIRQGHISFTSQKLQRSLGQACLFPNSLRSVSPSLNFYSFPLTFSCLPLANS